MSVRLIQESDRQRWDGFVAAAPRGHLLQAYGWGELKSRFGWQALRLAVEGESELVAGAQVLLRGTPLGPIAYVPRGPVAELVGQEAAAELWAAIHARCRAQDVIFLKIEPNCQEEPGLAEALQGLGFRPSPQRVQPRSTIVVDLTPELPAIAAQQKPKTRYNIGLAARKGVTVRPGDQGDLPALYSLMQETSQRDGFAIHSGEYYRQLWHIFGHQGTVRIFLANFQERLLAGIVVSAFGRRATYMYGASASEHRNLMPNHLLQWEAMKWAKAEGCTEYDLWGVPDEAGTETAKDRPQTRGSGLWGVYRFKQGFGGRLARYIGAWDYVYSPGRYWLYNQLLPHYRAARAMASRRRGGEPLL